MHYIQDNAAFCQARTPPDTDGVLQGRTKFRDDNSGKGGGGRVRVTILTFTIGYIELY